MAELRPHAWGRTYENHQRMKIDQLRAARARGETFFRMGVSGRVYNRRVVDQVVDQRPRQRVRLAV